METIKTIGVLVVLLVVGYLGYKAVTTPPPAPPREEEGPRPGSDPNVSLPIPELPAELAHQDSSRRDTDGTFSGRERSQQPPATAAMQPPPAFVGGTPAGSPVSSPSGGSNGGQQPGSAITPNAGMDSLPTRPAVGSLTSPAIAHPNRVSADSGSQVTASLMAGSGSQAGESASDSNVQQDTAAPRGIRKEFADFLEAAYQKLDRGEFAQVHTVLSAWYADPRLTPEEDAQLTDLLDQVAGTVIYSRQHLLERPYLVQPGDTLQSIAERFFVTPELLAKINGLSRPEELLAGSTLKVVRGPFEAVIHLQRRELVLMLQGRYAGRFRIGLGTDARQCEGVYQVREKTVAPRYFSDGGVYEPGDPRNPLGPKWIGLEGRLGIHAASDPGMFDNPQAPGAIFVSPKDIEDLFDILTIGSKVTITE